MNHIRTRTWVVAAVVVGLVLGAPAAGATADHRDGHDNPDRDRLRTVAAGLNGPRGVDALGRGITLVAEANGAFSVVVERRHRKARVSKLGRVRTQFAPALSVGPHGEVYVLTPAAQPGTRFARQAASLFVWQEGWQRPRRVADIAAYQRRDPDPHNVEGEPTESNPFGVQALDDGTVLVADAANNDLLRVERDGEIETVARLKPRLIRVPRSLPDQFGDVPPVRNVRAEAVTTSVTVGEDGAWYVGELRGFPGTRRTSQVWRIEPDSVDAICDPRRPHRGDCRRYADGLTSLVELAAGPDGEIYALSLSKRSWPFLEAGTPGAEIGGLFEITRREARDDRDDDSREDGDAYETEIGEIARGRLVAPGGVDVDSRGRIHVVGPVFGPGALSRIHH